MSAFWVMEEVYPGLTQIIETCITKMQKQDAILKINYSLNYFIYLKVLLTPND